MTKLVRDDIDLIQRWIFFDKMTDEQVIACINELGVQIDVSSAIRLAKLQKDYECGNVPLQTLLEAFEASNVE